MKKIFLIHIIFWSVISLASEPFQFAFISDLHIQYEFSEPTNDLKRVVNEINKNTSIQFVLLGGDVTNSGDLLSMTLLKSILDSLNKPYYAVPGNHDKMKGDSIVRHFQSIFGSDKFHFHTKSFHIIGFPTLPDSKRGGVRTQNNELLWLDSILKLSLPNEKILAVTHYPLQKGDVDNYTQIIDVLKKYPLLAVLNGHYHRNMLLNYDEIPGIVNRSTLSVGTQQGGYNIYTLNDSLHVAEKILDTPLREWLALPIEQ